MKINYESLFADNFQIVDKKSKQIDFAINPIQRKYISKMSKKDIILKARQQGFSTLITAIFTVDFLHLPNTNSVIVADNDENSEELLKKVKLFIQSYSEKNKIKIPLKYDSKNELQNELINSHFSVGTAGNVNFGRSRTINNLHLSEVAFYNNIENILAGAGQAVTEEGKIILETTANGFNEFKEIYNNSKIGLTGFQALFFKASDFYSADFLATKKMELKKYFCQEYPENDIECFLSSGDCFFDTENLKYIYNNCGNPVKHPDIIIYEAS